MNQDQNHCCGDKSQCTSANQIDTKNCSQRDENNECCKDFNRCETEFNIDGTDCPERGKEK